LCIASAIGPGAYLTLCPPGWSLVAGQPYWVRIKITAALNSGWYTLEADLLDPSFPGWLVQAAKFGFQKSDYFPLGESVNGVLARAPGSGVNIHFAAFDGGF